jgi:hypothetical protein
MDGCLQIIFITVEIIRHLSAHHVAWDISFNISL